MVGRDKGLMESGARILGLVPPSVAWGVGRASPSRRRLICGEKGLCQKMGRSSAFYSCLFQGNYIP